MNGIIINIDPVILDLGFFQLRWYSLAIMAGVIAALVIASREAKRKGIQVEHIYNLMPWVLIAGIIGARLFHIIDRWDYYSSNLFEIVQFQQGGLAIWGALIGGLVALFIYTRLKRIPPGIMLDTLVPALLAAQIIGRVGCIVNGDAYGGVTDLPWGFIYVHPDSAIPASLAGVPTHPYPVYEMLWNGLVLFLLWRFRRSIKQDGLLVVMYLVFYSVGRLILTTVRQENVIFLGLQQAQIMAIVILMLSLAVILYLLKKAKRNTLITSK